MSFYEGYFRDAPADASTSLVLTLDHASYGTTDDYELDVDWFRFEADANTTYLFKAEGHYDDDSIEVGLLGHAKPDVVNASGAVLAAGGRYHDEYTSGEVVFHSETAQSVFVAVSSSDGESYGVTAEVLDPSEPLGPVMRFGGLVLDHDDPIQLYFVPGGEEVVHGSSYTGFKHVSLDWSTAEQRIILDVLDHVSDFTGLRFEITQDAGAADMTFLQSADVDGVFMNAGHVPFSDYGTDDFQYPIYVDGSPDNLMGINPAVLDGAAPGSANFARVLKSLGNGLMLASPENAYYDSEKMLGVHRADPLGPFGLAQSVFTAMALTPGWDAAPVTQTPGGGAVHTAGFSALDIATLQAMYGANRSHATGNDDYQFDDLNMFVTIWDAGGTDTLRAYSEVGAVADLRAARYAYSEAGGGYVSHALDSAGGVTIAKGALIENARTGSGNDVVQGNYAANDIRTGAGNDLIHARNGNDVVVGGLGDDELHGGAGDDWLYGNGGLDTLYGDGGNDRMRGNRGEDTLDGGAGDDVMLGGGSADILLGGDGDDWLHGGGREDTLTGGTGDDVLIGDWGADVFVFAPGDGRDVIRDFTKGEDVIDISAHMLADFATVQGRAQDRDGFVKIVLGAGDVIYLDGLRATDLLESDFVF